MKTKKQEYLSFGSDIEKLECQRLNANHEMGKCLEKAGWTKAKLLSQTLWKKKIPGHGVCYLNTEGAIAVERSIDFRRYEKEMAKYKKLQERKSKKDQETRA